eukprot:11441138-Alexandrium_andersonii.AAC.1
MPADFGCVSSRGWLPSAGTSLPPCPKIEFGYKCVRGGALSVFVPLSDLCVFMGAAAAWASEEVASSPSTD